jgi:hypothetical protein
LRIQITLPGDTSPNRKEVVINDRGFDKSFELALKHLGKMLGWSWQKRKKVHDSTRNVYFEKWANFPMQKNLSKSELLYRTDPAHWAEHAPRT